MSRKRLIAIVVAAHVCVLMIAGFMGGCARDGKKRPLARVRPVEDIRAPEGEPESLLEPVGLVEETELLTARAPETIPTPAEKAPEEIPAVAPRAGREKPKAPVIPLLRPPPGQLSRAMKKTHKVAPGESLWKISRLYGVTVGDLADINGLDAKTILQVDQVLLIPRGTEIVEEEKEEGREEIAAPSAGEGETGSPGKHVIRKGESLWSISKKYGISWKKIAEANGIKDASRIREGQVIVIPGD